MTNPDLWQKLQAFEVGDPSAAFPFASRLARENGWSGEFADRVLDEYRRFLYLAMEAGHPVTPSVQVDQAWHLHMVYTRSYWEELCGTVFGKPLHHEPTKGGRQEAGKFVDWYTRTLETYEKEFGEAPPSDIWPPSEQRFASRQQRWVDGADHWIIPKPWPFRGQLKRKPEPGPRNPVLAWSMVVGGALLLVGCGWTQSSLSPLNWTARPFLTFYLFALAGLGIFAGLRVFFFRRRWNRNQVDPEMLDTYELAYLMGGEKRVREAALAKLVADGSLHYTSRKQFAASATPPSDLQPVEAALYRAGSSGSKFKGMLKVGEKEIRELKECLVAKGLVPHPATLLKHKLLCCLPFALLGILGFAKCFVGSSRGKDIGYAFFLSVVAFLLLFHFLEKLRNADQVRSTLKKGLRNVWPHTAEATAPSVQTRVVQYGFAAMAGIAGTEYLMEDYREQLPKQPNNEVDAGGGCSSSSDSGCGGGGGCGGCGGD
jgi:uncharacterized protein (TIGR04222 family)